MTGWLVPVILLCGGVTTATDGGALACRNKELAERFVEFTSPARDYTPAGLMEAFRPHAATLEGCLKRWVEDGGEQDGVPLRGQGVSRETYRVYALALLGQLHKKDEQVASWIRSNMRSWPRALQSQALSTLGEIGVQDSFAFLKAEARKSDGQRQEQIWWSLLLLDGQRFADELESMAQTHDEQVSLGSKLVKLRSPEAVPALRKLKMLVPEKAAVYEEYIREIEKSEDGGHDHEN